jgi:transposase
MKKQHVTLSEADRVYLQDLVKKSNVSAKTYKRALALLELDKGRSYTEVADLVGVVVQTASSWAGKYRNEGLTFLTDKPRPGRPINISGQERARITALACSEPPEGYEKWSLRLLADKAVELGLAEKVSYGSVRLILKKTNSSLI